MSANFTKVKQSCYTCASRLGQQFATFSATDERLRVLVADKDNSIKPGTRVVNQWQLGRALTGELELDPPIKALCVYNCNPVTQSAEQDKIVAG